MAAAILQLYRNPELARRLGQNGRRFVEKYYDRQVLAEKLHHKLMRMFANV